MKIPLRLAIAVALLATAMIGTVSAATLYVSLASTNPIPPFASWETAATNIQQAVDAAKAADTVLVTNGVYRVGVRDFSFWNTNSQELETWGLSRVVITNSIRLESINGPLVTTVEGNQSTEEYERTNGVRCVLLGTNAVLSGFTLTNGDGRGGGVCCGSTNATVTNCFMVGNSACTGGGAWGCTLFNCTLTDNSAPCDTGGVCGGGAKASTLYNCTLTGNSGYAAVGCTLHNCMVIGNDCGAFCCTLYNCALTGNSQRGAEGCTLYNCVLTGNSMPWGGGACRCTLYNCTLTGNTAENGAGGAYESMLYNCIVYYNTAPNGPNYLDCMFQYSCTTPIPTNGLGNITEPPLFMDMAAGDFRLREDSPCIDAGTNLVGLRMMATNVDTGEVFALAYSHDPTDILDNTRFIDGNGDGKVAWDIGAYEFNSFKAPRFSVFPHLTPDGWQLSINGAANKWVRLQRSANLKDWEDILSRFMGAKGVQQVNDSDTGPKTVFYRVVVQ